MKCISIIGNLGAQAVIRATSDGRQLMTFSVAVNQPNKDPLWFNCVSNMREKLFPYLVKGQSISVVGDLSCDLYNGKIDLSINADRIELCGAAPEKATQEPAQESPKTDIY